MRARSHLVRRTRGSGKVPKPGHRRRAKMRLRQISVILIAGAISVAIGACGKQGSSGTVAPPSVSGAGCAPIAGDKLVVLTDDKQLQNSDNIVAAINAKASTPALLAATDKVAAALDTNKLI